MAEPDLTPDPQAGAPVSGEPESDPTAAAAAVPAVQWTAPVSPETSSDTPAANEPAGDAAIAEPTAAAAPASEATAAEPTSSEPAAETPPARPTPEAATHEPSAAPEPVAAAEPSPVAEPALTVPSEPAVAASLEVPPLPAAEGGEWDLLVSNVNDWLERTDLAGQWERLQGPLRFLAVLIPVLVVLRIYSALIGGLESLPLVPGLLELVGVLTFVRFCLGRLVRSEERNRLVGDWKQRWNDFRGKS